MKKLFIGLGLCSLIASPFALANNIYSWTDDKGGVHYGEKPPKNVKARLVNSRTGHSDPVNYETEKTPTEPKTAQATAPAPSQERCELARKNLEVLKTNPRVRTTDKNGESRFMLPEEMQTQIETMERIITEECSG